MTAQDDPYVRVYYRIMDDPKFADVYDDDAAFALWVRLLLHADAMYPAPATLPRGVRRAPLDKLVKAELVDLGTGHRYRIHGLTAEREKRAEAARFAADVKHHGTAEALRRQSERSAGAVRAQSVRNADGVPLQDEPIRDKTSRSSPTPAGAVKNGSKTRENEGERLAAYAAIVANPKDHPAWKVDAARAALEVARVN